MDRTALLAKEFREFREEAGRRFDQLEAKLRETLTPVEIVPAAPVAAGPGTPTEAPAETSN
jgi:hypothetical protein